MSTLAELAGTNSAYPPEVAALHAALAKAQGEFPTITADRTVDTGSYTYSYAPLDVILAAVRPILSANGLALIQRLESPNGQPGIRTELLHADGATIAASFPLGPMPNSPQQLGSLLTYLRRYAVVALLGIAAEDDDDARQASSGPGQAATGPDDSPFQPPEPRQEPLVEDLTAPQRKKIFAIKTKLTDAGAFTEEQFTAKLLDSFDVDSVSGLSKDQASTVITWLLAAEDALER